MHRNLYFGLNFVNTKQIEIYGIFQASYYSSCTDYYCIWLMISWFTRKYFYLTPQFFSSMTSYQLELKAKNRFSVMSLVCLKVEDIFDNYRIMYHRPYLHTNSNFLIWSCFRKLAHRKHFRLLSWSTSFMCN